MHPPEDADDARVGEANLALWNPANMGALGPCLLPLDSDPAF